jgi:hypothetical protein
MYISTPSSSAVATTATGGFNGGGGSAEASKQDLVGVLTLASTDPHAFESSRLVWLLAMALAPFAAELQYAEPALRLENFVGSVMPLLLKENYLKTTMGRKTDNIGGDYLNTSAEFSNASFTSTNKEKQKVPEGRKNPLSSNASSSSSSRGDDDGKGEQELKTTTTTTTTTACSPLKSKAQAILGETEAEQNDTFDFLFNLVSMIIVYLAFLHATLKSDSSSGAAAAAAAAAAGSSNSTLSSRSLATLPIMKFIAGFDILYIAFQYIWNNVILPSMAQTDPALSFAFNQSQERPDPEKEQPSLASFLKSFVFSWTAMYIHVFSYLHTLFFLPMAHCYIVWTLLVKFQKFSRGEFFPNAWILAGLMMMFFWNTQIHAQSMVFSYVSSSSSKSTFYKQWGVDGTIFKERKMYYETVVLAAASAEQVCHRALGFEVTSWECLAAVSGVHFCLKQVVPLVILFCVLLRKKGLQKKNR